MNYDIGFACGFTVEATGILNNTAFERNRAGKHKRVENRQVEPLAYQRTRDWAGQRRRSHICGGSRKFKKRCLRKVVRVGVVRVGNVAQTLRRLKEDGFRIFGAAGDAAAEDLDRVGFSKKTLDKQIYAL